MHLSGNESSSGALAGLRVVEYGDFISAAYASKLLGDLGADVVKVEPPDGDSCRRRGPFPSRSPDPEKSGLFLFLNANKRGVALDASTGAGQADLDALLRWADVFITNYPAALLERQGVDAATAMGSNEGLVYVSITNFGLRSPRADWKGGSLTQSAASGLAHRMGDPGKAPLAPPYEAGDYWVGTHGAIAALLGVRGREAIGQGQHVWLAGVEVLGTVMKGAPLGEFAYLGTNRNRTGVHADPFYPWQIAPCRDGYFQIITMVDSQWEMFLDMVGRPELKTDERLQNRWLAPRWAEELDAYWHPWLQEHDKAALTKLFRERGLSFHPINTIDEVAESEQLACRNFWEKTSHPKAGTFVSPGAPYRLSGSPWAIRRPAPLLGEHDDEVREEAAQATHLPSAGNQAKEGGSAPLTGLRVLDHGHVWAGPVLGMMLGDMGAEVIKVQAPARRSGIAMSGHGTYEDALRAEMALPDDHPIAYHSYDRGKLSITLDLASPEGKALYKGLAAVSDVVIENFSPGVLDRLGLGYAELRKVNPGIIVASLSAAGATPGPWRDSKTYGPSVSALYGIKSFLGYVDDPHPREDTADVDPASASHALVAVLAALRYRDRTGAGQHVDVAQGEAALQRAAEPLMDYFFNGAVPVPHGNRYAGVAPHGIYRCRDSEDEEERERDRWVAIEAWSDEEWAALRDLARPDCPDIAEARFGTLENRLANEGDLDVVIERWTLGQAAEGVAERLQAVGVASYPVQGLMDLVNDPNYDAVRSELAAADERVAPDQIYLGIPWKLEKTPGAVRGPGPAVGQHNGVVFGQVLGMTPEAVAELAATGVIGGVT